MGGALWRYGLAPLVGAPTWPRPACVLRAEWGGAALRLVAPPALLALLHAHQFPDAALAQLPESLALAGLELAWRDLALAVEKLSGRKMRLTGIDQAGTEFDGVEPAAILWYALALESEAAGDGVQAWLALDVSALPLLALLARRLPALPSAALDPAIPLRLRLELGSLRLRAAALRGLAVHDVLMPDNAIDAAAPQLVLRAGGDHVLRARLETHGLVVESFLEKSMKSATPEIVDGVDALEINLDFDLGETIITVGELAAVAPGQVFPLEAPPARLVTIRANGACYAYGELVRIGERVGVRVLALAPRGDAP
ncbi:type III secretion system cytoplasmic ring protein SctQ [Rugamonas aquatica]|uniref:type III secretion system cytoplasmic ring protein SctQ n=1 Tax=Rugamonas aquatica TaxID=2743357 RepID=UPI001582001D|nr:type III secretion system cytoplasmic ring protein SctQ [Rugamonas aquatica]